MHPHLFGEATGALNLESFPVQWDRSGVWLPAWLSSGNTTKTVGGEALWTERWGQGGALWENAEGQLQLQLAKGLLIAPREWGGRSGLPRPPKQEVFLINSVSVSFSMKLLDTFETRTSKECLISYDYWDKIMCRPFSKSCQQVISFDDKSMTVLISLTNIIGEF